MSKKQEKLSPLNLKTYSQVLRMKQDNTDTPSFWLQIDLPKVSICAQKPGESATQHITLPKKDFDKLVRWYIKDQILSLRN